VLRILLLSRMRIKVMPQAPSATGRPAATAVLTWLARRLG